LPAEDGAWQVGNSSCQACECQQDRCGRESTLGQVVEFVRRSLISNDRYCPRHNITLSANQHAQWQQLRTISARISQPLTLTFGDTAVGTRRWRRSPQSYTFAARERGNASRIKGLACGAGSGEGPGTIASRALAGFAAFGKL